MIHFRNVAKVYNPGQIEVRAVTDATFDISFGEFVAVIGESGSGKSTLLHLIGALDRPTEGEVVIDGLATRNSSERELTIFRRTRLGFVFQFFNLLPGMTVIENASLPLLLQGVMKREAEDRAAVLLDAAGLGTKLRRMPDQLSGGEMQRVAVVRALVHRPAVLLADEPTGNLDSRNAAWVLDSICAAAGDTTVVLVTHSLEAAARATRRLHVADGRVRQE